MLNRNVEDITVEFLDGILGYLSFKLLTYPDRYTYEGAGPRCLYAEWNDLEILCEYGDYYVMGNGADGEPFSVAFNMETGERTQQLP